MYFHLFVLVRLGWPVIRCWFVADFSLNASCPILKFKELIKFSSNGVGASVSISTTPKMASWSIVTSYGAQLSMTIEQILWLLIETNCGIPKIVLCCGASMVATKFASGYGVPAKRVLTIFDDRAGTMICFVAWIVWTNCWSNRICFLKRHSWSCVCARNQCPECNRSGYDRVWVGFSPDCHLKHKGAILCERVSRSRFKIKSAVNFLWQWLVLENIFKNSCRHAGWYCSSVKSYDLAFPATVTLMWGRMKDVSPLKEFVHSDILLFAAIETLQIDKMICCITSRDPVWGTTESFSENPNGWCCWWLICSWPHWPSLGSRFFHCWWCIALSLMWDLQSSWWWPCFLQ